MDAEPYYRYYYDEASAFCPQPMNCGEDSEGESKEGTGVSSDDEEYHIDQCKKSQNDHDYFGVYIPHIKFSSSRLSLLIHSIWGPF